MSHYRLNDEPLQMEIQRLGCRLVPHMATWRRFFILLRPPRSVIATVNLLSAFLLRHVAGASNHSKHPNLRKIGHTHSTSGESKIATGRNVRLTEVKEQGY